MLPTGGKSTELGRRLGAVSSTRPMRHRLATTSFGCRNSIHLLYDQWNETKIVEQIEWRPRALESADGDVQFRVAASPSISQSHEVVSIKSQSPEVVSIDSPFPEFVSIKSAILIG